MEYAQTVTEITTSPKGEPLYSERATQIRLADEGGGVFIVLGQESGEVRLDPEEIDLVHDAAKQLLAQHDSREDG